MTQDAGTVPDNALTYSNDLTEADVIALRDFLIGRLEDVAGRHPEGSDEHAAAVGFSRLVEMDSLHLRDYVNAWRDVEHRHEYPVPARLLQQEIHFGWKHLCEAAADWRGHEEFDTGRWNELRYQHAQPQEFVDATETDDDGREWRSKAHP
ncbi:hypothetical protein I5Q34_07610 [Streptomyces sp. AV19]|uniref:hypothetical protein n=1 Tax=Streptomyces sp. AV19 TaxID=2793068 RepID=UPI0018FEABE9|nr:hypothetical protein [Streptomyces sp. AV19]MBH1934163.1 hypothetical protein [Streptomyces sp. AV19]MDG4533573.1 hypothetical protein [Streptomyces sp. AV19]